MPALHRKDFVVLPCTISIYNELSCTLEVYRKVLHVLDFMSEGPFRMVVH